MNQTDDVAAPDANEAKEDDSEAKENDVEEQKFEKAEKEEDETESEKAEEKKNISESSKTDGDIDKSAGDKNEIAEENAETNVETNATEDETKAAEDNTKTNVNGRKSPVDSIEAATEGSEQVSSVQLPAQEEEQQAGQQQAPISSISAGTRKPSESSDNRKPEKLELKSTPIPGPVSLSMLDSGNLTERLEKALGSVAPLLREIFVDFAPYLSKTLIGSHGQELLIGGNILEAIWNTRNAFWTCTSIKEKGFVL